MKKNKNKKILFAALFCMGAFTSCDVNNENILFQQTKKQLHLEYNQETESENISENSREKFKAVWVPVMEYKYILQDKSKEEFENDDDDDGDDKVTSADYNIDTSSEDIDENN